MGKGFEGIFMKDALNTVIKQIEVLREQKGIVTVAIDGKCTSGKTTLASMLAQRYDCNVFHMDDFFLRPEQRTPERLSEIGGNIDYERFQKEVLMPLQSGSSFSYRPYVCKTQMLSKSVCVFPKALNIIEGSYALHPYFGNPYDLRILLTVSEEIQRQRILERSAFLHRRFFDEWIPMENRYFQTLPAQSDLEAGYLVLP